MNSKNCLWFLILMLIFISCGEGKKEDEKIVYSEELSELVSKVTSGPILSTDKIKVLFNKNIINKEEEKIIEDKVFTFEPTLEGKTFWENYQTLVFQPDEPMTFRKQFKGSLELQKLSKNLQDSKVEKLVFNFEILGRELFSFNGELTLKNINAPDIVYYKGKLSFTENTPLEDLKESLILESDGNEYNLELFSDSDNKNFTFISDDIVRDNTTKDFKLTLKKDLLDLSQDFLEEFQVTTLEELKIVNIKKLEDDLIPKIRIEFSDDIDFDQKMNGLVTIENQKDIKIQMIGSSLILDGEFKFGEEYNLIVERGVRSKWGTKLKNKFTQLIKFKDKEPKIEFASDGIFLPESNQYKLQFYSTNIKRVHIEVKKVYDNSLIEFIQTEKLSSSANRHQPFNNNYINRVGVIIHNETFEISSEKNKLLLNEIDLSNVVKNNNKGLFLVRLNFNPRDMLFDNIENKYKYIEEEGQIYKPIIFSNIGLTSKISGNKCRVYATDIISSKPLKEVTVKLKYFYSNNTVLSQAVTDANGTATFNLNDYYWGNLFIEAEKDNQRSIIKFNEMQWNLSGFDVGGADDPESGIKTFIYTDRGVYRPGDEINFSFIVRNTDLEFPNNHPVTLALFNPQRKKVYELTNKNNSDGFYNFNIVTKESDQTGTWRGEFKIGDNTFNHDIKIETIVPYRLKVKINPEHKKILWNHKNLNFDIQCNYLFGSPGADLPVSVDLEIFHVNKSFPKYKEFIFSNPTFDFKKIQKNIYNGKLDQNGTQNISWALPSFSNISSSLNIKISASVMEKGGRENTAWLNVPVEHYSHYVGLQAPKYNYVSTGSDIKIPMILVDQNGNSVAGKSVKYNIYRNSRNWWWHYGDERKLKFKSDNNTVLISQGEIVTNDTYVNIKFVPIDKGEYFVEAVDVSGTGHSSGIFFSAYPYGGGRGEDKNAGTLTLRADKEKYFVGDDAEISFPAPKEGAILFTIERWNKILIEKWYFPDQNDEMVIKIPITKEMVPNAYATISVIQPHSQTLNDRPIRTFGVLPLNVVDKDTKNFIQIQTADQFRPKEDFIVNLQTSDRKQTQFTIAIVDEGLLDITQFKTPDPWSYFFKKIRLAVNTYDLFSQIIAANIGDVFKTFSIGGDMDYRESQLSPDRSKKRFKPVSLFKGPIFTDINGRASVKFKMPNYVGSVRIMVIGANKNRYTSSEKTVPVKNELMVLPTLPRVIGPGENFKLPVSVFAMKDKIGKVNVEVLTEGPLSIVGNKTEFLTFDKEDDKVCYFEISAKEEAGQAKVTIIAKSDLYFSNYETDIMVRPSSARIYKSSDYKIEKGKSEIIDIPKEGLKGTNRATLTLSNFPNINFGHRLNWLIHYPYGCIEQTTSSVFPQLFLKKFIKYPEAYSEEIDDNINSGLERLRKFQVLSGAFTYWPYENKASSWGTLYAGHFLVEAKKLGYHIAEDLYLNWLEFVKSEAQNHSGDLTTRVYRAYILAVDGKAELSEMNALKESQIDKMNNPQKWLLAASYKLAGLSTEAEILSSNLETSVNDYLEFSGTYGSSIRDKAMILEAAVILGEYDLADAITKELASYISSRTWYSTQTLSYSLMAIGKYLMTLQNKNDKLLIKGFVENSKGDKTEFNNEKTFELKITDAFGKPLKVYINNKTTTDFVYANLSWDGVPLKSETVTENKNLELTVSWLNEDGKEFDPTEIKQGTNFFGKFRVKNISAIPNIDEIALVQILPSGWEVINTRLLNESLPLWTKNLMLNSEDYLDIRDDRVLWFFDLYTRRKDDKIYNHLDFIIKLSAVTVGEYDLPATIVEAMYNNNFKASLAGRKVKVTNP